MSETGLNWTGESFCFPPRLVIGTALSSVINSGIRLLELKLLTTWSEDFNTMRGVKGLFGFTLSLYAGTSDSVAPSNVNLQNLYSSKQLPSEYQAFRSPNTKLTQRERKMKDEHLNGNIVKQTEI